MPESKFVYSSRQHYLRVVASRIQKEQGCSFSAAWAAANEKLRQDRAALYAPDVPPPDPHRTW